MKPQPITMAAEVSAKQLPGILKMLQSEGLKVKNVASDREILYVYLEDNETRDPAPFIRKHLKLPAPISPPPAVAAPVKKESPAPSAAPRRSGLGRLALVGWGGDSGVGRELIDAARHLPVDSLFIIPNQMKPTRQDLLKCENIYFSRGKALGQEMMKFLEKHKPDTILTWEVPGDWAFPELWERHGIHWVQVVHWDWFASERVEMWKKATLVAPNKFCQRQLKERCDLDATVIPVPIDTEQFQFTPRKKALQFGSLYGYGGKSNRRSVPEILGAWRQMKAPPPLTIHAQRFPQEPAAGRLPKGVRIRTENLRTPQEIWKDIDVAVQVSRYEGVGVSFLEAQSCGVPVIATNGPPMNEIAPDLLVSVSRKESVATMGGAFSAYVPSLEHLKKRVEALTGSDIRQLSKMARRRVENEFSWNALKGKWERVLEGGAV